MLYVTSTYERSVPSGARSRFDIVNDVATVAESAGKGKESAIKDSKCEVLNMLEELGMWVCQ